MTSAARAVRKLTRPDAWARIGKLGLVLSAEALLAPGFAAAAALLPEGPGAERLLLAQNLIRRRSLLWLLPQVRAAASAVKGDGAP